MVRNLSQLNITVDRALFSGAGSWYPTGPWFRRKNPASCTTQSHFFMHHIQAEIRLDWKLSYNLIRLQEIIGTGLNKTPSDRKLSCDLLEHTWSYILCVAKWYPFIHLLIKETWIRKSRSAKTVFTQVPAYCKKIFSPPFSCFCSMSHRIFTSRAETEEPMFWKEGVWLQMWADTSSHHQKPSPEAAIGRCRIAL